MRDADIRNSWRHVYEREYPNRLTRLSLTNISPLGTIDITFAGGITAVCGANGVGKSTLLRVLESLLRQQMPISDDPRSPIRRGGAAEASYVNKKGDFKLACSDEGAACVPALGQEIPVACVNALTSYLQQSRLAEMTNLSELLEGITPKEASQSELDVLRYVLGKHYSRVETYEIIEFDDDPIPFFRVVSDAIQYDSLSMGLGELSIHLVMWQLLRAEPLSMLLLEEPEAFVAPFSQEAILNTIASISENKKLWTVFTTHSPNILNRIPLEHIRLVSRVAGESKVTVPKSRSMLYDALRVSVPLHGIIFVEDSIGREFLKLLLGHLSFEWGREVEICSTGSDSAVIKVLQGVPSNLNRLRIVGVLDGDQRGKACVTNWPLLFLPGNDPPEKLFHATAINNVIALATAIGRRPEQLHAALGGVEHTDHHDWPIELARTLSISIEQLNSALFSIWIANQDNYKLAEQLVGELRSHIRPTP